MSLEYEVRQVVANDRQAVSEFLDTALRGHDRYPERWEWLNLYNPFIPQGYGIPAWIALAQGKIIGHTGAMLVRLKIGSNSHLAAWSVDTMVLPEMRGSGVGKRLQAANQEANRIFMSLVMSAANRAIKKKLGGYEGPAPSLYYYTRRILPSALFANIQLKARSRWGKVGKCLLALCDHLGVGRGVAGLLARLIGIHQRRDVFAARNHALELVPVAGRFALEADTIWAKIRERYTFTVERNSTYLNWKYVEQPFMDHQRYCVCSKDGIVGILVLRKGTPPEPPIGVISECLLLDNSTDACAEVLRYATNILLEQGVIGIWGAGSEPAVDAALAGLGFLRVGRDSIIFHGVDVSILGMAPYKATLLSKGDHDWDQYPDLTQPFPRQIINLAMGRDGSIQ